MVGLPQRVAIGMALVAVCVGAFGAGSAGAISLAPGFRDEVVFTGLQEPTAMRFAPDGRAFVAEKSGKVLVFDGLEDETPTEFVDLSELVYDHGDRGLLGLALDPKFDEGRPYVYLLYTYDHILGATGAEGAVPRWGNPAHPVGDSCPAPPQAEVDDCPVSGRLVRLTAEGDHARLGSSGEVEEKVLVEDWCQQFSSHSIGDLEFDSSGALYASGGDGASFYDVDYGQWGWPQVNQCGDPPNPPGTADAPPSAEGGALRSQDLRTSGDQLGLDGTVIRIDPDTGEGLPGNPMFGSANPNARRIVAYGMRNPFRFALDEEDDELYVGNVGWNTWEEIDRMPMLPNRPYNSGWPCYEGREKNHHYEGLGLEICQGLYDEPGSTSPPFFAYEHGAAVFPEDQCDSSTGSAISGMAVYPASGPFPPAYDHALFFADPVRGCIFVAFAGADGRPDASTVSDFMWEGGVYPGVDLEVGPEGDLYYVKIFDATEEVGKIRRISYEPDAPVARISAGPRWGPLNLQVNFDGSGSSDPNGESLSYAWDLDGDGQFDDSTSASPSFTYKSAQNVTVALRVEDGTGKTGVAKAVVYPGDTPPTATITKPSPSLTWGVGQQIEFAGEATDAEDGGGGQLAASALSWKTRILHCPASCHVHPLQSYPETRSGVLEAPDHDYPSHLEFVFTATDSRGLSATDSVLIDARPATIHLASDPPGALLGAGTVSETAPFDLTAIEGGHITLSAPPSFTVGGQALPFSGWSDGGARVHAIVAGAGDTYTARYGLAGDDRQVSAEPPLPVPSLVPPPRAHILKRPPKRSASSSARFAFNADEAGPRFQCRLDGGPFKPCRSPRLYRHLGAGAHSFAVRAVNAEGGIGRPVRFGWRVLPRPPR
jgi:glucose/arabinose dehydrogenase